MSKSKSLDVEIAGLGGYSILFDADLDVPFVPTDDVIIDMMLDMAKVNAQDILYDLGCGDGRILIKAASEFNTQGVGVEIDPERIAEALEDAAYAQVEFMLDFVEESIYTAAISEATVVTMYLLHSVNLDLRPRLLNELRPGTRVISHSFDMGDWKPDEKRELGGICVFKWIIPAQIAGIWKWTDTEGHWFGVELEQEFQEIKGTAWREGQDALLTSATLCGNTLELSIQHDDSSKAQHFTLHFDNNELQEVVEAT